jgi:hypothetical protein
MAPALELAALDPPAPSLAWMPLVLVLEVLELTLLALAAVARELVAPPVPVALPTLAPPAPSSLL